MTLTIWLPLIPVTQNYSKVAWGELMVGQPDALRTHPPPSPTPASSSPCVPRCVVTQDRGRIFKIQSFEMGVLLLPSRYPSLPQRTFSCTPDHPLLGLASPGHKDITAFVATSCQAAK